MNMDAITGVSETICIVVLLGSLSTTRAKDSLIGYHVSTISDLERQVNRWEKQNMEHLIRNLWKTILPWVHKL